MTSYLTYENIEWNKYLFIFNQMEYIQCIFIIPEKELNNCLKIGTINLIDIYDITFNKLLKLNLIGPFITKKEFTKNYNGTNLEESIINFFIENKFFKWIGISDKDLNCNYTSNYFNIYDQLNTKNYCFIIPNRNREKTLEITKNNLFNYIKKNNILADIWIIHQNNLINWNKGVTLNIGFKILEQFYDYFIFNDADTFIQDDINKNIFFPKNKELIHIYGYNHCIGGIFIINKNDFKLINGFSNKYFNWGREDTDLQDRLLLNKIKINREYINKNVKELEHANCNNLWNYKKETKEYKIAKKIFYFNMIEYLKKDYSNGLTNLKEGNYINCQIIYLMKFEYYDNSIIKLSSGKTEIIIEFKKKDILDEINIFYKNFKYELPITDNFELKLSLTNINNKKYFELTIDSLNNITFEIDEYNPNKTEVVFNNIKKEYVIKYTPFNTDIIYYSFYPKISFQSYNLFVNY